MAGIEVSHIVQFKSNIRLTLQKTTSLMRPHIGVDTDVGGEGYRPEMTVGEGSYQERDTRFERKTIQNLSHDGRWIEPRDFDVGPYPEDKLDRIRNGMEMMGTYTGVVSAAIRRAEDDVVLAALFGSAKTGKQGGGTPATFDSTNMRVDHGSAGLTVNKTIDAKQKLKKYHNDLRTENPNLAITEIQWGNLMRDITYTSAEFQNGHVLTKGEAEQVLGFNLVEFSSLDFPYLSSTNRRCPFWMKSGVRLADYDLMDPKIYQDTNLRGDPWMIYAMFTLGAARLDEKKVGDILCAESIPPPN
jgi:hypothetical protein